MSGQSELLQPLVESAGNVSGKVAAGSSLGTLILNFFGSNAVAIGAICSVITLLLFAFFGFANLIIKKRATEAYYRAKIEEEMGIKDE